MTRLGEALLEIDDPPVASLLIYASNPMASVPDQRKVRRGLAREDLFTVVVDHFQTNTADDADLLLPSTMQTEHADLHDAYGHLRAIRCTAGARHRFPSRRNTRSVSRSRKLRIIEAKDRCAR